MQTKKEVCVIYTAKPNCAYPLETETVNKIVYNGTAWFRARWRLRPTDKPDYIEQGCIPWEIPKRTKEPPDTSARWTQERAKWDGAQTEKHQVMRQVMCKTLQLEPPLGKSTLLYIHPLFQFSACFWMNVAPKTQGLDQTKARPRIFRKCWNIIKSFTTTYMCISVGLLFFFFCLFTYFYFL